MISRAPAVVLIAAALLAGCTTTRPPEPVPAAPPPPAPAPPPSYGVTAGSELNALLSDRFDETRAVDVWYVTNRARGQRPGCDNDAFTVEPADSLSFGICRMNVPRDHSIGSLALAPNARADPHAYFRVLSHEGLSSDELEARLVTARPDLLIFVHGFNVKFEEAVLRASQIAYDLKFQGEVVLFSWPAGAPSGLFSSARVERTYDHNTRTAAGAVDAFATFFGMLERTGRIVHLLVHSMGHQVVIPGLLAAATDSSHASIGELVLNAPDYAVAAFRDALPTLRRLARRTTVYCSYNDNAIAASEYRNDSRRMGGCALAAGVDVVNVGEIDAPTMGIGGLGHGYYASRPILTDIFQVLIGIEAGKRLFVRRAEVNSTQDFFLRK